MQELISLVCAAVQLLLYIPKHSLPLHHPLPNAKAVSFLLGVCMEVLHVRCAQPALLPCCPHCVPPAVSQPWELRGAHKPHMGKHPQHFILPFPLFVESWTQIILSKAILKSKEMTSVTLPLSSGAVSSLQKVTGLVRKNRLVSPIILALAAPRQDLHFPLGGLLPLNTVSIPAPILWWELLPSH